MASSVPSFRNKESITRMCEEAGIDPPDDDMYANQPHAPLTLEQVRAINSHTKERKGKGTKNGGSAAKVAKASRTPLPTKRHAQSTAKESKATSQIRLALPTAAQVFSHNPPSMPDISLLDILGLDAPAIPQARPVVNDRMSCDQCGRSFKTKSTFRQHLGDVHIGTKCVWGGCAFVAASERALNDHLKLHNDVAAQHIPDGNLICHWEGCGAKCCNVESVARHLRRHTIKAKGGVQPQEG